jgi:D-glycero-D-manno-heptose 1,7-bisphosphate phosphatase
MSAPAGATVFLDRDGTLIRDVDYLCRVEQIELLPEVPAALALLREHGFKLVVITNQSAVARGYLSEAELGVIHASLIEQLAREGAILDAIYYCPHHPTEGIGGVYQAACSCRKPSPGMIDLAVKQLGANPSRSYVVGDQWIDLEVARRSGATGILIDGEKAGVRARSYSSAVVADLWQAARWIIEHADTAAKLVDQP